MRLIDELLKDDFFHGGYRPASAAASAKAAPGSIGPANKKLIIIAAAVGGLVVLGAGGFFIFSGKKETPAAAIEAAPTPETAVAATAQQPAAAPQAAPAAAPAAEAPAAAVPAPEAAVPAPAAAVPAPVAAPTPPPAPAVVAAVAPPAPVAAKPAKPDMYTLVFPKFSDKEKAEAIVAKLKSSGASAKLSTGSDKTKSYRVKSAKNATAAESNAIKLKAMIFKIPATPSPQADGTILYDLGTFKTKAEAEAIVVSAKKLAHEVAISEEKTSVPVYSIDVEKASEDEARSNLGALGNDGDGVKVKKVK